MGHWQTHGTGLWYEVHPDAIQKNVGEDLDYEVKHNVRPGQGRFTSRSATRKHIGMIYKMLVRDYARDHGLSVSYVREAVGGPKWWQDAASDKYAEAEEQGTYPGGLAKYY